MAEKIKALRYLGMHDGLYMPQTFTDSARMLRYEK